MRSGSGFYFRRRRRRRGGRRVNPRRRGAARPVRAACALLLLVRDGRGWFRCVGGRSARACSRVAGQGGVKRGRMKGMERPRAEEGASFLRSLPSPPPPLLLLAPPLLLKKPLGTINNSTSLTPTTSNVDSRRHTQTHQRGAAKQSRRRRRRRRRARGRQRARVSIAPSVARARARASRLRRPRWPGACDSDPLPNHDSVWAHRDDG